ncbi:terminase small subunit [Rhodomicrobium vannielii ATCC 17100]|nr:terminase small subunit [Rhodomicrobium vannielii ATCC 17100]
MTERALRFASEYVIDADGKAAAMRAGYAGKSAATTASRLLGDPRIQAIIGDARTRVAASAEVTAERVPPNSKGSRAPCLHQVQDRDPSLSNAA